MQYLRNVGGGGGAEVETDRFDCGEDWVISVILSELIRVWVKRSVAFSEGLRCGLRGEPFVEGDGEGEELFFVAVFIWYGVDHLDVELGAFEGVVVELANVVEEIAGEGAVGVDGGGL